MELESLKVELESIELTDKSIKDFTKKCVEYIKLQFGPNHFLIKNLGNITTEPKGSYFPEMIEKEKSNALLTCKEDLATLLNSVAFEFNRLIVDKPIEEIIKNEESQFLEFKSTLIWDVHNSKPDKKIMGEIIMKAISAFSNSEGGILLIGISNDKKVVGLNSDYNTFRGGKGNRDDFELHLTSLIVNSFSNTFAKDNISIEFPEVNSKEICLIRIKRGDIPYTLKISDKSGHQKEKFFIRVNNSSREIDDLLEFARYIKNRFSDWN